MPSGEGTDGAFPIRRARIVAARLDTPDDKLATYGIDDPDVAGVACHFTVPEKGA
jgi:catabolite regulation protein CreA